MCNVKFEVIFLVKNLRISSLRSTRKKHAHFILRIKFKKFTIHIAFKKIGLIKNLNFAKKKNSQQMISVLS